MSQDFITQAINKSSKNINELIQRVSKTAELIKKKRASIKSFTHVLSSLDVCNNEVVVKKKK